MNHIHALQHRAKVSEKKAQAFEAALLDYATHLIQHPKFRKEQPDGSRGDWVATADVATFISTLIHAVNCIEDSND